MDTTTLRSLVDAAAALDKAHVDAECCLAAVAIGDALGCVRRAMLAIIDAAVAEDAE